MLGVRLLSSLTVLVLLALSPLATPAQAKGLAREAQQSRPLVEAPAARRRGPIVTTVDATAELRYLNGVNRERAARGLQPLVRDEGLRDLARYHSADMALGEFVGLTSPGSGALLDRAVTTAGVAAGDVAANVAVGTDLTRAGSSLLDPAIGRVGVGIVAAGGRLFLTQVAVTGQVAVTPDVATPPAQRYTARDGGSLSMLGERFKLFVSGTLAARRALAFRW
jgi:uncharacterized protein YkwD